ncbi:hypothetical protein [Streptomyces sp. XH2]
MTTDFPDIPCTHHHALESLARLRPGDDRLRAACHDTAARLFGL